jgi:hypothetical protein
VGLDERLDRAVTFLAAHGAGEIPHPGGMLLPHLSRTAGRLRRWGSSDELVLAGQCHAAYGTDWFDVPLIGWDERELLRDVIGDDAEALVHLYCRYDRTWGYERLGLEEPVRARDRVTGELTVTPDEALSRFLELTFANEIDVASVNDGYFGTEAPKEAAAFARCRSKVSAAASADFGEVFGLHLV